MLIREDIKFKNKICFRCGEPIITLPFIVLLGKNKRGRTTRLLLHMPCTHSIGNELAEDIAFFNTVIVRGN